MVVGISGIIDSLVNLMSLGNDKGALALYDLLYSTTEKSHHNPVNTKHLYNICAMSDQRRRRWDDVAQMLYKCFVLAGKSKVPEGL